MKNLILLVILSLFALPVAGLAGGKLQIEDTAFDLSATTTWQCSNDSYVNIHGSVIDMAGKGSGESGIKVSGATIILSGKGHWNKYEAQTKTDVNGSYKFCGLSDGNYVLEASKEGLGANTFKIINFDAAISSDSPQGLSANIYFWDDAIGGKGSIKGIIMGDHAKGTKVKIHNRKGDNTQTITSDDGVFEFNNLEKGKYNLVAWKAGKKKKYTIGLKKNTTYYLYVKLTK